jgi:Bacterial Ig-like domain
VRTSWYSARSTLRGLRRQWLRPMNALLAAGVSWVVLGSSPSTAAYLTATLSESGNAIATAKQFTISDVAAVAQPGGTIKVSWSVASWAAGGYSIRRATSGSGPFVEQTVAPAGTTSYTDSTGISSGTYWYAIFGLSGAGGMGTGSTVVSATADAVAPTVASTTPAAGASNVTLNSQITVNFSEPMNAAPTAAGTALLDCGTSATCASGTVPVAGATRWPSSSSLIFSPTRTLNATTYYALQLTTAAADVTGNGLSCTGASLQSGSTCWWIFETGSTAGAPGLAAASPANGALGVPTNAALRFSWSAALTATGQAAAQTGFTLQQVSGSGSPCYVFAGNGQTPLCSQNGGTWTNPYADSSRLVLSNPLLSNTTYTASEVANDASNLVVNWSATWTTGAATDTTPPTVTGAVPATGTTGVSPKATVDVTFSETMAPDATAHAFALQAWSDPGSCTRTLGTAVTGNITWTTPSKMEFLPSADLMAGTCYHVAIGSGATDTSENSLTYAGADFTVLGGAPPTVTLSSGDYYYPGATVTASGGGWTLGSGNVVPKWDDGSTLDATGAALSSGAFSNYTFSLPTNASSGAHRIDFVRSGGATISVSITVQSPNALSLSAERTDIAAGDSTVITATVYDGGQAAANARVSFAITTDAGGRGSLSAPTALTNGSGQASVTLSVSSGGPFTPITVTATIGTASRTITIIDPAPLPPAGVHATASDKLEVSWVASPSPATSIGHYDVLIGTSAGQYERVANAGSGLSWIEANAVAGQTYYVAVRAVGPQGAQSEATPEVKVTAPALAATRIGLAGSGAAAGAESANVTATVFDQYGRPMPASVTWSVPSGFAVAGSSGTQTEALTTSVTVSRHDASLGTATVRAGSGAATASLDLTFAVVATPTATATATGTATPTNTATSTPTASATAAPTLETATATPTVVSSTATPTPVATATAAIATPTLATTPIVPTMTSTPAATSTATVAATPVGTPTPTAIAGTTATQAPSGTVPATATPGPSGTGLATATPTAAATSVPTSGATATEVAATVTPAATATRAATATALPATATPARSPTSVATATPVPPTATPARAAATATPSH